MNTNISDAENKILNVSSLVDASVHNIKIGEVENKTLNVNGWVKKPYYDPKIKYIETKYFTNFDYSKKYEWHIWGEDKTKKLVDKPGLSWIITKLGANAQLKGEQEKITKILKYNSSYFLIMIFFW